MGAPARWITASVPLTAAGSRPPATASGAQRTSPGDCGARLTRRMISCPSPARSALRALPISPVDPVIATFIRLISSAVRGCLPILSQGHSPAGSGYGRLAWRAGAAAADSPVPAARRRRRYRLPVDPRPAAGLARGHVRGTSDLRTVVRITGGWLEAKLRLESPLFQPGLHRHQEPRGVGAVDQPVVVGQGEVDHGPHRDHLAERGIIFF